MPSRDLAPLLAALTVATNKRFDGATFESRLRIQKTVYLLNALGNATAKEYSFGSYFRGPYSPALARAYYSNEMPIAVAPAGVARNHLDIVGEAVLKGNDFLEAVATLHSFSHKNAAVSPEEVQDYVRTIKPRLSGVTKEAWAFLVKNKLVGGRTSTPVS